MEANLSASNLPGIASAVGPRERSKPLGILPPDGFLHPLVVQIYEAAQQLEVAVLDRSRKGRAFRRIADAALTTLLGGGTDTPEKELGDAGAAADAVPPGPGPDKPTISAASGPRSGAQSRREMQMMADAGLSPMQILVSATKNAAEYMGLKDLGTISPGHWADFLILDADPLSDIRNARRISGVFIGGEPVAQDASDRHRH